MLNDSQRRAYLKRIKFRDDLDLTQECLHGLHLAHIKSVPFENLDIPLKRRISLKPEHILTKLLEEKRGGFCYELNFGFSLLLDSLGFEVSLLSARVFNGARFGKDFDHLLLLVNLKNESFIADVGFGDSFREPLKLEGGISTQVNVRYKIERNGGSYTLQQQKNDEEWATQYIFKLQSHDIHDFEEMCNYQQTSPESGFTKKSVCTIATDDGRATISNGRLIITSAGHKDQKLIRCSNEYKCLLLKYFKIILPDNLSTAVLLADSQLYNKQNQVKT